MTQRYIKLSEYAKNNCVTYKTAHNRFKSGKIIGAIRDDTGHILVPVNNPINDNDNKCIIYARVSSNTQKKDLYKQTERLKSFAAAKGYNIVGVKSEIASGMNDSRKALTNILQRDDWGVLLVENKDRLTRFGFNYLKVLLEKSDKKIEVMNLNDNEKTDLMADLISIIYSFSARIYGLRRRKKRDEIESFLDTQK